MKSPSFSTIILGLLLFVLSQQLLLCDAATADENNSSNNSEEMTSTATTTTTKWEKAKHAINLVRDLVFQVGHDGSSTTKTTTKKKYAPRNNGISLIGAGMPRTGTKSIEEALSKVGFRVYDLRAIMEHGHEQRWFDVTKAWKEDGNLELMDILLTEIEAMGYSATLDTPLHLLAPAMIQLRPKALVLWSHRDTAEVWYSSFVFIVYFAEQWQYGRPLKWIFPQISSWIWPIEELLLPFPGHGDSNKMGDPSHFIRIFPWYDLLKTDEGPLKNDPILKQNWIDLYNNTPKKLKEVIGGEQDDDEYNNTKRFLEFNVKQGWEPLLEFLSISDDDNLRQQAFPYVNERGTLIGAIKVMHVLGAGLPLWVFLFCLYLPYRIIRRLLVFGQHTLLSSKKATNIMENKMKST